MRRRLIVTVAASVSMVLLAMLVPLAVLLQDYALEDRLARVGLEVQATETVVSTDDKGDIAVYIATINEQNPEIQTTVLYPGGTPDIGPSPGENERVLQARLTGVARVDDAAGGAEVLVPVSLGPSSGPPTQTPVIRVEVAQPGLGSGIFRAWLILAGLGLLMFLAALLLADRLGRQLVRPIQALAGFTQRLGEHSPPEPVTVTGPPEIRQLGQALNQLVHRIQVLLGRERERVSDLSHRLRTPLTALQLRIDALPDSPDRERLAAELADLHATLDMVMREARRSEHEGLVPVADGAAVLADRARFWQPLADDQGRSFTISVTTPSPAPVQATESDLMALLDVLLDNVFAHTPENAATRIHLGPRAAGGLILTVEDDGPGVAPADLARGTSSTGSSGLGLSIARATANESGGALRVERGPRGGARICVELGAPPSAGVSHPARSGTPDG